MKKMIVMLSMAAVSACAFAGPCGRSCGGAPRGCPGGWRLGPVPCHYPSGCYRPCNYDGWGRGGRNFWPGFVGGLVGGIVANTVVSPTPVVVSQPAVVAQPVVVTQPTVITQPVVTQTVVAQPVTTTQNVWVEGRYIDTVQANGAVVRTWQPGHYEQRTVVVQ